MEMKICSKCGEELPKTTEYYTKRKESKDGFNGTCRQCRNNYNAQYYKDNRETRLAHDSQYYKTNKELIAKRRKVQRKAHKESITKYKKQYYESNKATILIQKKQYYEEHKSTKLEHQRQYYETTKAEHAERARQYKLTNKERIRSLYQCREAKKKELPATLTAEQWEATKAYFNNCCAYCGRKLRLAQDHFIPISKGGAYTQGNIIPACTTCNCSKKNKDFEDWYPGYKYYSEERADFIIGYLNSIK